MYIYYFSNYVYKLYWTNNYSVQSDTKYFQPLKGTLKYFYLLFVIIYYTSRAKTQMFRNTTSKPPIGKMMTFPRSRRKAGIRKSNITLSVDINIRFEFMPPGSTVCTGRCKARFGSDRLHSAPSLSGAGMVAAWNTGNLLNSIEAQTVSLTSSSASFKLDNIEFRLCRHSQSLDSRYLPVVSSSYNIPLRHL